MNQHSVSQCFSTIFHIGLSCYICYIRKTRGFEHPIGGPVHLPRLTEDNQDRAQDVRNLDWTAEWPAILEDSPVAGEIEAAAWRWRSGEVENDGDRDYHGSMEENSGISWDQYIGK